MKIIGVSSIKDEPEFPTTFVHMTNQGLDRIIVSSPGGEWGELQEGPFDQGAEITRLAYMAATDGADWIIPFDADEFWIDPLGGTIRSVLEAQPPDVLKVHCAVFKHADWDHKYVTQNPMGKVCFRPSPEMTVAWGNHDVQLSQSGNEEHGLLEIRELQYRDYDHFLQKVQKARELFASWDVPPEYGHHMRLLAELPDQALPAAFLNLRDGETVLDPIPR